MRISTPSMHQSSNYLTRNLAKPWFTPPSGIFAPVWTLLYIMIAVAGWRSFAHDPLGPAMIVWIIALALNFSWSPIFFGLNQPAAAFGVTFIRVTWPQDAVAALLFVPTPHGPRLPRY